MADHRNKIGQGPNEGLDKRTDQQNQQSEVRKKGLLRMLAERACCRPSVLGDEVDQQPSTSGEASGSGDRMERKREGKKLADLRSAVDHVAREVELPNTRNELGKAHKRNHFLEQSIGNMVDSTLEILDVKRELENQLHETKEELEKASRENTEQAKTIQKLQEQLKEREKQIQQSISERPSVLETWDKIMRDKNRDRKTGEVPRSIAGREASNAEKASTSKASEPGDQAEAKGPTA